MVLEAQLHKANSFATLTYSDEHCPVSLVPEHLQKWLKRLRDRVAPSRFRFFACGEYGHEGQREFNPHFHVALFGFPACVFGRSRFPRSGPGGCCPFCDLIRETWGFGHVLLGEVSWKSANYIAQYQTKKMTAADDARLQGRHQEFARMSMRPGLAADYAPAMAGGLLEASYDERSVDVPGDLRLGSRIVPLGRFLRQKLRSAVGRDEATPPSVLEELNAKLLPLRARAERMASDKGGSKALERKIFQKLLSEEHEGLARSKIARHHIMAKGVL